MLPSSRLIVQHRYIDDISVAYQPVEENFVPVSVSLIRVASCPADLSQAARRGCSAVEVEHPRRMSLDH